MSRPWGAGLAALLLAVCGCSSAPDSPPARALQAGSPTATPTSTAMSSAGAGASPGGSAATAPRPADPRRTPTVTGVVASGLDTPWGLVFLPDGSALVGLRDSGRIVRVPAQGGTPTPVGSVPGAGRGDTSEGGLLGLALHPDFPAQPWVYAFYTTPGDNRLARMRYADGVLGPPQVLLRGIAAAAYHNSGRIGFGPDGLLYVPTGDGTQRERAQDPRSPNGKILRLTAEGKPAPGNPTPGSPVYSLGHRNIEGIAWDSKGRLWASEFGQDTWDELNQIVAGANYGWPEQEGKGDNADFRNPLVQWHTDDASPAGVAVVGGYAYVAALKGERLWRVPLDGGAPKAFFTGTYGRLRTIVVAPDGALWLTTSNTDGRGRAGRADDRILRVVLR